MRFFSRVGALVLAIYSVSCSTDFKQIGNACFCRADSKDTKDTAHDCDCDAMSALSAVYLGRGLEPAASIVMYDPDDDPSFVCLFEDVSVGQEMECLAGSVGHFSKKIVFSIESGDGEICEGTLDTSCSSQLLDSKGKNEEGEGCEALRFVVTGYVGADGRVCDDGYAPCDCDAAMAQQSKDSKHDGTEETETHSNSDSADIDADSQSDDDDVDGEGEGDEDGEQDSYDETSTTSWSEPWTSSTTTTSTTSTTSSIDTSDESNDDKESNDDNDWALRLSQYVHSMKNTDTDSASTTDSASSPSTSKSESSDDSSASDDSDSESDSQFMTTATSSGSSSDDDDDDESASSNISGQGSSSSDSNLNSNEDTDDDDDDDDMYDDDDKDDDDDSIDESYDDDSASSGGTTDNASDSTTDSDSDGSSSSESESHSESEVDSEYEIADSNSDEVDSEIGDSEDAAYTDSRSDSDSQIESDSDSNAIATGTFGLITRLGEGRFGGEIETTLEVDDSHSAGYAADVGSFAAAPKMWADSTDTTPYEKYSFYTLVAILLLNVTAFGWCLCTRARTGKRTERKSLDGVEYAQGKLTEKIEIMEEAADDTDDDETEEEDEEEEDEDEVFTD